MDGYPPPPPSVREEGLAAERALTELSVIECTFQWRCSSSGSRVMCRFVETCWKRQILTFGHWRPLVIWSLTWPKKWPQRMPLTACRYIHGPGAELEGGGECSNTPDNACSAPSTGPARVKNWRCWRRLKFWPFRSENVWNDVTKTSLKKDKVRSNLPKVNLHKLIKLSPWNFQYPSGHQFYIVCASINVLPTICWPNMTL